MGAGKIGVTIDTYTEHLSSKEVLSIVQQCEELGFESVWLTDTMGREPFVLATYLLSNTVKIGIGTGIANVYGRDAMTAKQIRHTLSEMFPGRFLMGLGPSAPHMNEMRKAKILPPAEKMSTYLDDMEAFNIISAAPESLAPVYISAHGPLIQKIAVEKTDGILTWVMPAQHTKVAREHVGRACEISCHAPFILNADPVQSRALAREHLALWLSLPWYCKAWGSAGFSDADLADGGSDVFIDSVMAWGDANAIQSHIQNRFKAGANRVLLQPIRKTRDCEPRDIMHQTDTAFDGEALEALAKTIF